MTTQKTMTMRFLRDGTAVIDMEGFKGRGCGEASKAMELLLSGGDSSNLSDSKKPDFYGVTHGATHTV